MEQIANVPIDLIDPNPAQVRLDYGDVSELKESIRTQGLLQHIRARVSFISPASP